MNKKDQYFFYKGIPIALKKLFIPEQEFIAYCILIFFFFSFSMAHSFCSTLLGLTKSFLWSLGFYFLRRLNSQLFYPLGFILTIDKNPWECEEFKAFLDLSLKASDTVASDVRAGGLWFFFRFSIKLLWIWIFFLIE